MRVVHLSSYDTTGGAARSAFRLHESLLAAGHPSAMLVRTRNSRSDSVEQVACYGECERFFADLIQEHYLNQNRTEVSNTWFSLSWPGEDLSNHPLVEQANIIHLHWVTNLVSACSLAALIGLGKPIVWTLHDQRPYTGGCHYAAGCTQYEMDCAACPQLVADPCRLPAANLADQLQLVRPGAVTVIAPSRWMAECARRSAVFARARIEVIPYGIDAERFQAVPQPLARTRLGLPADAFLLLFGVDNGSEKRKGLRELVQALRACAKQEPFRQVIKQKRATLLSFGNLKPAPALPLPVISFGRIDSDELLSSLYSAADLFLLPSLEDNLPNTVLESMSCGTPVAAFSTGGVPDLVVDGETGFLAPTGDVQKLGEIILMGAGAPQALRNMRLACRRHVQAHFSMRQQAEACLALYHDLLRKGSRAPRKEALCSAGPQFQQVFPQLLQHVFENVRDLPLAFKRNSMGGAGPICRARFVHRVKSALKSGKPGPHGFAELRASLAAELANLQRKSPWRLQAKRLFTRLLGKS